MALTVGELNGIITIDDRAVNPALRRAENALRDAGDQMGDDAQRAGDDVGERLGEGVRRNAIGRLIDARGRFVAAGRQAGDSVGEGLTDGAGEGADEAVGETESRLSKLKTAALGIGAAAGAVLVDAFGQAMEQNQITAKLGASMGKTPAEAQRYGKIAGQLYADAVTEDFQGAADVIGAVMAAGLVPADATNAQIQSIAANLHDLSDTFELDLGQAANAVGQIMKTGLAPNAKVALDVMTRGMQVMGPRADDLADTFNEYSTIFRQLGISAGDATGILAQGMAAGARDTDVVADSLKELVLITQGGGPKVDAAFKSIGLSGKDMQAAFTKGGPEAKKALDQIFDGLRNVKDPAKRAQLAVALFGTKAEDMQKALFSIDPSKAKRSLGEVGGAADKMGGSLRDNAATQVEAFKRGLQQGVVNFLGSTVIPKLTTFVGFLRDHQGEFKLFAAVILAVVVPALIALGVQALIAGGQMAMAWVAALGPIGWIGLAIGALVVLVITYWDQIKSWTLAAWNWVVAKLMWAKDMMVQAFLNFTLIGLIIKHWGAIKSATVSAWNATVAWVKGIPGRLYNAFLNWTLLGLIIKHWSKIKTATVTKALEMVAWVRGLPGRISAGIGSLGSLLTQKGVNVVQGLWNGIRSMGGWIKSKILGWARSVIPGPIAKALGIASPSKVTKAQGQWIARGLIDGLTGSSKQIKAAATKLADIVRDSMAPGRKRSKALGTISAARKKLLSLASQEEKVAARMKTAQKKVADLIKSRDKLAADVKKGVLDSANITSQDNTGGWPQTAETILAGLKQDRAAAETFAKNLAILRKKGVRSDLIAQIAQAGVEQGSSAAAALANANSDQIKAINKEQGALVTAAGNAGTTAGNAMYGAGIAAGQGLVKGLQKQQKAIEAQMLKIAKAMSKSIKKALGIKSPSKVMARVGAYTAEGLQKGIESGRSAVTRSMASLVETPAPGSWDMASAHARAAASQRTVLELRSSGRAEDDYLIGRVRRSIRKKGGGDVDLVLAGRRSI